jgi:hypothetical protein
MNPASFGEAGSAVARWIHDVSSFRLAEGFGGPP